MAKKRKGCCVHFLLSPHKRRMCCADMMLHDTVGVQTRSCNSTTAGSFAAVLRGVDADAEGRPAGSYDKRYNLMLSNSCLRGHCELLDIHPSKLFSKLRCYECT